MRLSFSAIVWFCIVVVIFLPIGLVLGLRSYAPERALYAEWSVRVHLDEEGKIISMPLEDYVIGVVAAEVPALFQPEALKAQAVATRTYVVKKLRERNSQTGAVYHEGADICDDPRHGQAYATPGALVKRWGVLNYIGYRRRIAQAVRATSGEVLLSNGELIDAVYHSTSGDWTENSEDVWGRYVPYLRAVPCRWDKDSPRYSQTKKISGAALEQALGVQVARDASTQGGGRGIPTLAPRRLKSDAVAIRSLTSTGRVRAAVIGGRSFTGLELREKLGLYSTHIRFKIEGDSVVITTMGSGHGVGLCQYGANGLAKTGRRYRDILAYYFTGAVIGIAGPAEVRP
jgi:stage II sporulation protein D